MKRNYTACWQNVVCKYSHVAFQTPNPLNNSISRRCKSHSDQTAVSFSYMTLLTWFGISCSSLFNARRKAIVVTFKMESSDISIFLLPVSVASTLDLLRGKCQNLICYRSSWSTFTHLRNNVTQYTGPVNRTAVTVNLQLSVLKTRDLWTTLLTWSTVRSIILFRFVKHFSYIFLC